MSNRAKPTQSLSILDGSSCKSFIQLPASSSPLATSARHGLADRHTVILDGHNKKSKTDKPEAIARETEKLICKALMVRWHRNALRVHLAIRSRSLRTA